MIFARGRQNHPEMFFSLLLLRSHPLTIRNFFGLEWGPSLCWLEEEKRGHALFMWQVYLVLFKMYSKTESKVYFTSEKLTNWLSKSLSTALTHTMWLFCDFYLYIGMFLLFHFIAFFRYIHIFIRKLKVCGNLVLSDDSYHF